MLGTELESGDIRKAFFLTFAFLARNEYKGYTASKHIYLAGRVSFVLY